MNLKNPRHERFAQALAKGQTLEAAYRGAGYSGGRSAASMLARRGEITRRVEELRDDSAEAMGFDRRDFLTTLRDRFVNGDPLNPTTARYGEILAKAQGWNEPEKISFSGELRVVIGGPSA
ncbi:MAG: hypothetical protein SFU53_05645 [Terrimicrobiaceae bacterium]|nr:hypothetical protein [Terrimicrobiaceae bacterium]